MLSDGVTQVPRFPSLCAGFSVNLKKILFLLLTVRCDRSVTESCLFSRLPRLQHEADEDRLTESARARCGDTATCFSIPHKQFYVPENEKILNYYYIYVFLNKQFVNIFHIVRIQYEILHVIQRSSTTRFGLTD